METGWHTGRRMCPMPPVKGGRCHLSTLREGGYPSQRIAVCSDNRPSVRCVMPKNRRVRARGSGTTMRALPRSCQLALCCANARSKLPQMVFIAVPRLLIDELVACNIVVRHVDCSSVFRVRQAPCHVPYDRHLPENLRSCGVRSRRFCFRCVSTPRLASARLQKAMHLTAVTIREPGPRKRCRNAQEARIVMRRSRQRPETHQARGPRA